VLDTVSVATPLQAEALACWKALLFAADRGMMMIEMESDCVTLKQALSSRDFDAASFSERSSFPCYPRSMMSRLGPYLACVTLLLIA
jgi:hypothetical protein